MTAPILLTGGTGTLGSHVIPRLRGAGHDVRVLTRTPRESEDGVEYVVGDLDTGTGVDEAVDGIEIIIHAAGAAKGDDVKARRLVAAAAAGGTLHLVNISVVGADRIPVVSRTDRAMFGYFASKRAAEAIIADSGVPWTTLRAAQFHELMFATVRQMSKLPVVPVPSGFRFQPVDGGEVADRLVELAMGTPSGLVADLGGPRAFPMEELVRSYLRATNRHRLLLPLRPPGKAAQAIRSGANLTPDRAVGRRTWEEFLAGRLGASERRQSAA